MSMTVNGAVLIIASLIHSSFIIHYVVFEVQTHGLKALSTNKFVLITLLGNFSVLLDSIYTILEAFIVDGTFTVSPMTLKLINLVVMVGFWLILSSHLALVFLRSQAVFKTSGFYLKFIRFLLILFFSLEVATSATYFVHFFVFSIAQFVRIAQGFYLSAMSILSIIDIVSTFAFARYVREIDSSIDSNTSLVWNQVHIRQRNTIVSRSVVICFVATLSVILYWIASNISRELQSTSRAISGYLILAEGMLLMVCMILWMRLKMELDGIAHEHLKGPSLNRTPKVNLNAKQTEVIVSTTK
jgi:hypothetical protein